MCLVIVYTIFSTLIVVKIGTTISPVNTIIWPAHNIAIRLFVYEIFGFPNEKKVDYTVCHVLDYVLDYRHEKNRLYSVRTA